MRSDRDIARLLLEAAENAALLAVGGAPSPWLGGRVRAAVARRAPCPLLVVPPVPRLGGAEVVCGIRDWADVATAEVGASLALGLGLELTLVHVLPTPVGSGWRAPVPDVGLFEPPWDDIAADRLLDAVGQAVAAAPARRVAHGPAGRTLAHEAAERDAAILVIGAPRYGRVGSALTGSASTWLLRRTARPLVVCPTHQRVLSAPDQRTTLA